jgi:hypothetical protein
MIDRRHGVAPRDQLCELAPARGDFTFAQRHGLQTIAHCLFDCIGDALTGALCKHSDQLVGFSVLDQNGHIELRIYQQYAGIYDGTVDASCPSTIECAAEPSHFH